MENKIYRNGSEFRVGNTVRDKYLGIVTVLSTDKKHYDEDGWSFGVGAESGYLYIAEVRTATDEEAAIVINAEQKEAARSNRRKIARRIIENGRTPRKAEIVGDAILDTSDIYGSGSWFVIDEAGGKIWYVKNNGADGDDWTLSNVKTAGVSAIGTFIKYNEEIAQELRSIQEILR